MTETANVTQTQREPEWEDLSLEGPMTLENDINQTTLI